LDLVVTQLEVDGIAGSRVVDLPGSAAPTT
jgi:hypothetical protein